MDVRSWKGLGASAKRHWTVVSGFCARDNPFGRIGLGDLPDSAGGNHVAVGKVAVQFQPDHRLVILALGKPTAPVLILVAKQPGGTGRRSEIEQAYASTREHQGSDSLLRVVNAGPIMLHKYGPGGPVSTAPPTRPDSRIDYGATDSVGLQLVPAGPARDGLADDYNRMLADGMLLDDGEPFEQIIEPCAWIEARANDR